MRPKTKTTAAPASGIRVQDKGETMLLVPDVIKDGLEMAIISLRLLASHDDCPPLLADEILASVPAINDWIDGNIIHRAEFNELKPAHEIAKLLADDTDKEERATILTRLLDSIGIDSSAERREQMLQDWLEIIYRESGEAERAVQDFRFKALSQLPQLSPEGRILNGTAPPAVPSAPSDVPRSSAIPARKSSNRAKAGKRGPIASSADQSARSLSRKRASAISR